MTGKTERGKGRRNKRGRNGRMTVRGGEDGKRRRKRREHRWERGRTGRGKGKAGWRTESEEERGRAGHGRERCSKAEREGRKEERKREMNQTMDAIIPSYRPGEKFYRLLAMLKKQRLPLGKIIVVNTERRFFDEERAREAAGERLELHHIEKRDFDHGGSRNLGVSFSDSELFLMLTDDAVPRSTELTERLSSAFLRGERIGAVYGRQLATKESSFDERYARRFNYPEQSFVKSIEDLPRLSIKTYFMSNVCCAYRRDLFDRLGGFPSPMIFNEDMVYAARLLRLGYRIAYEAEAEVYHAHCYSGLQQLRRNFDLGVSQAEHPEIFSDLRPEGEGKRLIKGNLRELLREGRAWKIPALIWKSGCKYLGYLLGKNYRRLPGRLRSALSMNKGYWRRRGGK